MALNQGKSKNCTLTKELYTLKVQIDTKLTRGRNPRALEPEELEGLKQQYGVLRAQMDQKKKRLGMRINAHTTDEAILVIREIHDHVDAATKANNGFFSAVGGAGSSTDLMAQSQVMKERAKQVGKEELSKVRADKVNGRKKEKDEKKQKVEEDT